VFEVVSAEDRAAKLAKKVRLFLRHGAKEIWLIYPETRDAYVYKPGLDVAVREEKTVHSDLLPGIEIPFDQFCKGVSRYNNPPCARLSVSFF